MNDSDQRLSKVERRLLDELLAFRAALRLTRHSRLGARREPGPREGVMADGSRTRGWRSPVSLWRA
jgi:hypothetical protein